LNGIFKFLIVPVFLFSFVSLSYAGSIKVVPTKVFLGGGKKAEVLKVINEGDDKVTVQVEAMKWTEDESGVDKYEPTEDIVFFPKIFTVEKGKEWLLRIGAKSQKPETKEASYRVFLQEIPVSKPGGSQLTMALRLSVPVFIKPVREVRSWELVNAELSKESLLIRVKNTGNSHISVSRMKAAGLDSSGKEIFKTEEAGWYVLPGVTRTFGMKIPGKECRDASVIRVTAEVGEASKDTKVDVDKSLCPKDAEKPKIVDQGKKP
jgi:fimbrial chaperone protein